MEIEYDYIHLRHGYEGDVTISSTEKKEKKKIFSTSNTRGNNISRW